MENKLKLRVGDVVRLKPLTVQQIDPDGDVFFRGYRGLLDIEAIESIISHAETDAEKIARLEAELAKAPQWIDWSGGECPVGPYTMVVVRRRDGELVMRKADFFKWEWPAQKGDPDCDIIAYMVLPS